MPILTEELRTLTLQISYCDIPGLSQEQDHKIEAAYWILEASTIM